MSCGLSERSPVGARAAFRSHERWSNGSAPATRLAYAGQVVVGALIRLEPVTGPPERVTITCCQVSVIEIIRSLQVGFRWP